MDARGSVDDVGQAELRAPTKRDGREAAVSGCLAASALVVGTGVLIHWSWSIEAAAFVWLLYWLVVAGAVFIHRLARAEPSTEADPTPPPGPRAGR